MAGSTRAIRKAELLDASTKLFAARGFHGTRMDDVAEAAGINKATVYHYYPAKSLILYDIYMRATDETLAVFDSIEDSCSAADALRQYTQLILALIARRPEQAAVYFLESPFLNEWLEGEQIKEIRSREHLYQEKLQDIIERGVKTGEFTNCDPHIIALGYIGMTSGAHRWFRTRGRLSPSEIAEQFSTAILGGLLSPSRASNADRARRPARNGGARKTKV